VYLSRKNGLVEADIRYQHILQGAAYGKNWVLVLSETVFSTLQSRGTSLTVKTIVLNPAQSQSIRLQVKRMFSIRHVLKGPASIEQHVLRQVYVVIKDQPPYIQYVRMYVTVASAVRYGFTGPSTCMVMPSFNPSNGPISVSIYKLKYKVYRCEQSIFSLDNAKRMS
jgi:hypothetical protein